MQTLILLLASTLAVQAGRVEVGPWCGAVTPTSAVVKARTTGEVWLELPDRPPVAPTFSESGLATYRLENLKPDTLYTYRLGDRGGQFRTFPTGRASFRFVFGSCSTGTNHPVYRAMAETEPLFYLHLGDLHYADIATNEPALYRRALESVFGQPYHAELLQRAPLVYVWDDHDYGPNDSDRTSPSRAAAQKVYREYIPHYPLLDAEAIYQSFTVGRVKFLLTDLRSHRTPNAAEDNEEKSMMGAAQKAWFLQQLLDARNRYPLVFWVSSVTWIGKAGRADHWAGFSNERRQLANFFKQHGIHNVCMLTGDGHCVAADDGRNGDYAEGGGAPLPVLMSSPLDQGGNCKGGPYSHGLYVPGRGEGMYGVVDVEDRGDEILVTFHGRNHRHEEKVHLQLGMTASGIDDP
ncbi:MAG: alkaline phosphatase D family protein [Verrucomicrobiae bacterium]|nr:alkaline phosphatase D family protein [Verrucomicrobiae bacterium]